MKRFTKLLFLFTFSLICGMLKIEVANALPLVAIDVGSAKVNVGKEVTIGIVITSENIEGMAAWGGTLFFDSTLLSLKGAKAGSFTIPDTSFLSNQPEPGKLIMLDYGLSRSVASGQGTIAEVSFIASKPGSALIKLADFGFCDPDANEIFVQMGDDKILEVIPNMGDINNDGDTDISDVILDLRIALGLDSPAPCSDINGDGYVDISDVILTLRMALGLDELKQCK